MTEPQDRAQDKCPACAHDLVVEDRYTFHGDWYCVCAECDELIDFADPSYAPLDLDD